MSQEQPAKDWVGPQEQARIGARARASYEMAASGERAPAEIARWLSPDEPAYPDCEAAALRLKAYAIARGAYAGSLPEREAERADQAYHMALGRADAIGALEMVNFALERAALPEVGAAAKIAAAASSFAALGLAWARKGCPEGPSAEWLAWFARDALEASGEFAQDCAVMMLAALSKSVADAELRSGEDWPGAKRALSASLWEILSALDPLDEAAAIKAYLLSCSEEGLESLLS